jgi:hypothetical protein
MAPPSVTILVVIVGVATVYVEVSEGRWALTWPSAIRYPGMAATLSRVVQERNALSPVFVVDSILHSPYREPARPLRCSMAQEANKGVGASAATLMVGLTPAGRQIRSRQRVADHGEVFTPAWLVEDMLDFVKDETERIDARFLEPACGSGNFLVVVLRRKLAAVDARYGAQRIRAPTLRAARSDVHRRHRTVNRTGNRGDSIALKEDGVHVRHEAQPKLSSLSA